MILLSMMKHSYLFKYDNYFTKNFNDMLNVLNIDYNFNRLGYYFNLIKTFEWRTFLSQQQKYFSPVQKMLNVGYGNKKRISHNVRSKTVYFYSQKAFNVK